MLAKRSPGNSFLNSIDRVLKRDNYVCQYCGFDGKKWPNWLYLSLEHLLPRDHPERNTPDFIVTACRFCNGADNRWKWAVGFDFEGKTAEEIVAQRKPFVLAVRERYKEFWQEHIGIVIEAEEQALVEEWCQSYIDHPQSEDWEPWPGTKTNAPL